jgi:hypothetical protein
VRRLAGDEGAAAVGLSLVVGPSRGVLEPAADLPLEAGSGSPAGFEPR